MTLLREIINLSTLNESTTDFGAPKKQVQDFLKTAVSAGGKAIEKLLGVPNQPGSYNKPVYRVDGMSLKNDGMRFNVTCLSQNGAELGDDFALRTTLKIARESASFDEFLTLLRKNPQMTADAKEIAKIIVKDAKVLKTVEL